MILNFNAFYHSKKKIIEPNLECLYLPTKIKKVKWNLTKMYGLYVIMYYPDNVCLIANQLNVNLFKDSKEQLVLPIVLESFKSNLVNVLHFKNAI